MNLKRFEHIYFVGIGGIGMSALAHYFHAAGKTVSGYDKTPSAITNALLDKGIEVVFNDSINAINSTALNRHHTLVVYTPAVPNTNAILNYFRSHGFEILKRAQVLGHVTQDTFCMAVAGTHGKTTTSSILGYLLESTNQKATAFLGGISENYNSNLIQNGNEITVVEADEFDRSFLSLRPNFACITAIDPDHLDIYGDAKTLAQAFENFAKLLPTDGRLFVHHEVPMAGITYGVETQADYAAINLTVYNGTYHFDLKTPSSCIRNFELNMAGKHNLSNAVVALAMAIEKGISEDALRNALKDYKGVKRRFSYILKNDNLVFIDDYAHHPKELLAVSNALKEMHPNQKATAVFQPHLYSRTQDFASEFAKVLSEFDAVLLLDIYPARERPIEGITSEWLLKKIKSRYKTLVQKSALVDAIKAIGNPLLVTLGAGDIGAEVEPLKQALIDG
jgi:UDP-N-acetylmuramate--alanine ligase